MTDLHAAARTHLQAARDSEHGRSAALVLHDGVLRQSLIALSAGSELAEHNPPPAASLQVLEGRVRVTAAQDHEVAAGQLLAIPRERHGVTALEDSAFLLTTVTSLPEGAGAPAG